MNHDLFIGLFVTMLKFLGMFLGVWVLAYLIGGTNLLTLKYIFKKGISIFLKIIMYVLLAYVIFVGIDFLSLIEIEKYSQLGHPSILYFFTQNMPLSFAIILIIPYFIVSNLRLWKKFE